MKTELLFENIMTSDVLFYDECYKDELKNFCMERDITYLPSVEQTNVCYELIDDDFKRTVIEDEQIVKVDDFVFNSYVLERFKKHAVLFVFNKNQLAGIVHFSDYNREPVYIYLFNVLINFEKNLRKLLTLHGLKNEDMAAFFEKHANNECYSKKLEDYNKESEIEKRKHLKPFQTFYLTDLIGLLNHKKIFDVSEKICDLRNHIVHFVSPVQHENYTEKKLIYTFDSFDKFFNNVKVLEEQYKKVTNKLNVMRLKHG